MATTSAIQEWTNTTNLITQSVINDGAVTLTKVSMWALSTAAPFDLDIKFKGRGTALGVATGNAIVSYQWFNETGTGSATVQTADNNWNLAMVVDMNTGCAIQATARIPVGGNVLAIQLENSAGASLTLITIAAIPVFINSNTA